MHYTSDQIRTTWLEFWKKNDHVIIPSSSIVPDNDPTALFINSGMHPLVPYLMGEKHPAGTRLANAQKCIRTVDIDEVGDPTHLSFFEMLGNWSLGDYFKHEKLAWSFEFLTKELKLPLEKLAVSVFEGDENAPRDEEAATRWIDVGMPKARIAYLNAAENWWKLNDIGVCGTDSEMFYWTGPDPAPKSFQETWEDPHWVEIGNDVFMEFDKQKDGSLVPLPNKNIDTGMGLERLVTVINGFSSVYQTDVFADILETIGTLSQKPELAQNPIGTTDEHQSLRIVADHIRTSCIMLADGVAPSNTDQGYILRRIIRRAIRHGRKLGINEGLTPPLAKVVLQKLGDTYPELKTNEAKIISELEIEEKQFRKTLITGEREFSKAFDRLGKIDGETAFDLYQTYGFPIEMTQELATERDTTVDMEGYEKALKAHQEKSRSASSGKFKGGLTESSDETKKLHTATHLLHTALREVLGGHVQQRGSNITAERLRFDFCHEEKMTPEQKQLVEQKVNDAIAANVAITCEEMSPDEARGQGAIGLFGDKYGDVVKVYTMGSFSKEICGGPHADNTGDLGRFKIKKEESSSRGVRRIKAVLIEE